MNNHKLLIKKCCGLKQITDIEYILANNDAFKYTHLGIILVPNKKRSFPLKESLNLAELVAAYKGNISIVGVVQKQGFEDIDKILSQNELPLTHIQIHDSSSDWFEMVLKLNKKYPDLNFIKRFVFPTDCQLLDELLTTDKYDKQLVNLRSRLHILFDSSSGGNGEVQDWNGINDYLNKTIKGDTENFKVIIAGGLTPDNVAACISQIDKLQGIDVSGGVENSDTVGVKDKAKLASFALNSEI